MNFSINPLTFQTMKIGTEDQQKKFLYQLSTLLSQATSQISVLSTFNGLSAILNGNNSLNYNSLNISASALGSVSTNQTINCASAAMVTVSLSPTASITLTLNNLGSGVPVCMRVTPTGAFVLKMAATTPASAAYAINASNNGGAVVNMVSTGVTLSALTFGFFTESNTLESGTQTLWLGLIG